MGAGFVGKTAGLGFLEAGFADVTIHCDRDSAALRHDGPFSSERLEKQFERFRDHRGEAVIEGTRLVLGDPKHATHAALPFPASIANVKIASALFHFPSGPQALLRLYSREDVTGRLMPPSAFRGAAGTFAAVVPV